MARQRGLIKLQGTIGGITFVDSKAYDPHPRAARGTHKKAALNDVCQGNADNAKPATSVGSPILRQLKTIEKGFAEGRLWSRMMGRMLKAKSTKTSDLLESLNGVEINERYSFVKLFATMPRLSIIVRKHILGIEAAIYCHAQFSREVKANGYLYKVFVLFLDSKGSCLMEEMETEWISFDEDTSVYEMEFTIPRDVKYFLIVEEAKAGRDGKEIESFATRGIRIGGWGKTGNRKQ